MGKVVLFAYDICDCVAKLVNYQVRVLYVPFEVDISDLLSKVSCYFE